LKKRKINVRFINENLLSTSEYLIVFLHNGLGSVAQWGNFPSFICDSLNIPGLAYDRVNYGKSEKDNTFWNTNFLEREANEILPYLISLYNLQKKLILIGHSDGATISLIFAAYNTISVAGVVAIAPHVFVEDKTINGIKNLIEEYTKKTLYRKLSKYHQNIDELFYNWTSIWLSEKFKKWNITKLLPLIRCPVLVIQGDKDEFATIEHIEYIRKNIENVNVQILSNAHHTFNLDEQKYIGELIFDFFKKYVCTSDYKDSH
jgi:pimeloyl-ACP methyl ester carboxylesterase